MVLDLTVATTCIFVKPDGERCRSSAMRDSDYCFWCPPDHAEEVAEARRLDGLYPKLSALERVREVF